ncbi:dTDP-4-dehydrorhamnose 3,5-epimerase family protein [Synechococcus sp. W4D4]|uniref:dTDP-4-dehydrorhamnose 3,5-epimerase family protein n=1 Tax=Synechococcus sp. W4D4 TaxID=3392294 RepID=UPI0039ED5DDF
MIEVFPDCYLYNHQAYVDERGYFLKTFHPSFFSKQFILAEQFVTTSKSNVVRGMHLQTPPHAQYKTVTCIAGQVIDVVLDLRCDSPTFKHHYSFEMSTHSESILIPPGVCHGFASIVEQSTLLYNVTKCYSPTHDTGVAYESFGFDWPFPNPVLSQRDKTLPHIEEFLSQNKLFIVP